METYDVRKHYVPLKKSFPALHYDLSVHCSNILQANPYPFPAYLNEFHKQLSAYSSQINEVKPKRFPKGYRIYAIDQRLHVPLILHDPDRKMYDFCYDVAKSGRPMSEYAFGNGEELERALHYDILSDPDPQKVNAFVQAYGFLPFEELALPSLVMFFGDQCKPLLTCAWHINVLMEHFREENLVDMNQHAQLLFSRYA
ncbi:hypothetical protein LJC42_07000 [Eubacteriales bacterium OttesenSCG-928-K08]|nr:hypothetical protein [Eubacteriales bacterium OttesenSCG-928-K08]